MADKGDKPKKCPKGQRRNAEGECVEFAGFVKGEKVPRKKILKADREAPTRERCPPNTKKNKEGNCVDKEGNIVSRNTTSEKRILNQNLTNLSPEEKLIKMAALAELKEREELEKKAAATELLRREEQKEKKNPVGRPEKPARRTVSKEEMVAYHFQYLEEEKAKEEEKEKAKEKEKEKAKVGRPVQKAKRVVNEELYVEGEKEEKEEREKAAKVGRPAKKVGKLITLERNLPEWMLEMLSDDLNPYVPPTDAERAKLLKQEEIEKAHDEAIRRGEKERKRKRQEFKEKELKKIKEAKAREQEK